MTKKKKVQIQRGPGRPRENFEFYEARELVRNEQLSSVKQYEKWWAFNTPAKIPKRPDRAYKNEWKGWNDFLGTNNPFPFIRRKFRSFIEARQFAQSLGLRTKAEWIAYAKGSKKPHDIPSRPDLIYREDWYTWADFLGANVASVKRNIESADAIFFIIQNPGRPGNVYQMGITLEGKQTIYNAQRQRGFRIMGMFYCDIELGWESFANELGRKYYESGLENEYLIPNINDFVFQLSDFVEPIRN